jgi:hypothetical protein
MTVNMLVRQELSEAQCAHKDLILFVIVLVRSS